MRLREIAIFSIAELVPQKKFNEEMWCVQEHFLSKLNNYDSGRFVKVVVRLFKDKQTTENEINCIGQVISIHKQFDFSSYGRLDNHAKKAMVIKTLLDGIVHIATEETWKIDPLLE